jgi:hypothetical protein
VLKAQDWEAQFSNKQRLLLNSVKKTVRLVRDIVALERRKPDDARVAVAGFVGTDLLPPLMIDHGIDVIAHGTGVIDHVLGHQ